MNALVLQDIGDLRIETRPEPLITHTFPLSKIHDAFHTAESRQGMKIVVHPQDA